MVIRDGSRHFIVVNLVVNRTKMHGFRIKVFDLHVKVNKRGYGENPGLR